MRSNSLSSHIIQSSMCNTITLVMFLVCLVMVTTKPLTIEDVPWLSMLQRTGHCTGCNIVVKQYDDGHTIQRIQNPNTGKVWKIFENDTVVLASAGVGTIRDS